MIRPLAFIALASPVMAQEAAAFCGGLGQASIVPDGSEYVVTVVNPLCPNNGWPNELTVITLSIDGMSVPVQLWSEPGRDPDTFVVLPPIGWLADPAALTVEEHDSGVIRLLPLGLS